MGVREVLSLSVLQNTVAQWVVAVLAALLIGLAVALAKRVLVAPVARLTARTRLRVDDLLPELAQATRVWLAFFPALYLTTRPLALTPAQDQYLRVAGVLAVLVQAALWGNRVIDWWLRGYRERADGSAPAYTAVAFISRLLLWSVAIILILDNIPGIEITSLVAGLGITGVAVALAVQNILTDLFASLSIVLDEPFAIGDYIVVGDFQGTVQHVGLKSTRVRSLSGEEIIFSNSDLLDSRIRNYKRMLERRVMFRLGVMYETPPDHLERIPGMVREIVEAQEPVRFGRAHFARYEDWALIFEVVYYVLSPDHELYMDIQQAINLALYRRFDQEGVKFAYPTQRLVMQMVPAEGGEGEGGGDE